MRRNIPLFWRVFAVNGGLLAAIAVLLIVTPVTISAPIKLEQALIIIVGLAITLAANVLLLRRVVAPLGQLARGWRRSISCAGASGSTSGVTMRSAALSGHSTACSTGSRASASRVAGRVLAAQEAERVGIARDLHDEVGQVLTGVLLHLNSIAEEVPTHRDEIDAAKQAVRVALDEVRRISSELRPEMLEHLGLVSALTELSTTFARVSGLRVERQFDPALPKLSPDVELAVYRIAQEGLTNVARHADATR